MTNMAKLVEIEGIGEKYSAQLESAGVSTQAQLLEAGKDPKGRKSLAEASGLTEKLILKWVNRADLARVKGIGEEYADLLECSGVDTVPDLATRNAANLHAKMTEVNAEKKLVRALPTGEQVEKWVEQAKTMDRAVHY
jgi:predicted flap endonuclease-1-like 5' DNA nuclease